MKDRMVPSTGAKTDDYEDFPSFCFFQNHFKMNKKDENKQNKKTPAATFSILDPQKQMPQTKLNLAR